MDSCCVPAPLADELQAERVVAGLQVHIRDELLAGNLTNFATPAASQPLYLPWIADRLAGKPAADGGAAEDVQSV